MLNMMRVLTMLVSTLLFSNVIAETVYRTVDEHGNVIFSDTPTENSEEIEVQEPQRIAPLSDGNFEYTPPEKEHKPYKKLAITAPGNDEAIRDNGGNVSVTVVAEPGLASNHVLVLYLDGKEYGTGTSSFSLSNLDRGSHRLRAVIKNTEGKILISSATITFHLLRHSVLNKQRPAPPPQASR